MLPTLNSKVAILSIVLMVFLLLMECLGCHYQNLAEEKIVIDARTENISFDSLLTMDCEFVGDCASLEIKNILEESEVTWSPTEKIYRVEVLWGHLPLFAELQTNKHSYFFTKYNYLNRWALLTNDDIAILNKHISE